MWAAMVERYGHWQLDTAKLENFLRRAIQNHNEILDWARGAIPERLYMASFDEVVRDPKNLIARIVEFCSDRVLARGDAQLEDSGATDQQS
jgi:hypothetical protein